MAYKVLRVEISEVIRRWQAGDSRRHIASGTGLSKDTVGKYISAAEAMGIVRDGPITPGPTEPILTLPTVRTNCHIASLAPVSRRYRGWRYGTHAQEADRRAHGSSGQGHQCLPALARLGIPTSAQGGMGAGERARGQFALRMEGQRPKDGVQGGMIDTGPALA